MVLRDRLTVVDALVRFSRLIWWKIQTHDAELESVRGSETILIRVIQQRLYWLCTGGCCREIAWAAVFARKKCDKHAWLLSPIGL